jgi:hypothetical protein
LKKYFQKLSISISLGRDGMRKELSKAETTLINYRGAAKKGSNEREERERGREKLAEFYKDAEEGGSANSSASVASRNRQRGN